MRTNEVGRWYVVSSELDADQIDIVASSEPPALQPAVREYQVARARLLHYDGTVVRRHCVAYSNKNILTPRA